MTHDLKFTLTRLKINKSHHFTESFLNYDERFQPKIFTFK